jgi:hypothetical protein
MFALPEISSFLDKDALDHYGDVVTPAGGGANKYDWPSSRLASRNSFKVL